MSELDDLVRNRRFDEIHEARRQVNHDKRELDDAIAAGQLSDSLARRLYQRSVNRYVQELEPILNPPQAENEPDKTSIYWTDVKIGTIQLPDGDAVTVEGLLEYLNLEEEIEVQIVSNSTGSYYDVPTTEVQTVAVQPPWRLLDSAFRTANSALADVGMEIDPTRQSDLYTIKRDPDEYDEPKTDGIPKPK
jgi:hypothetical protein